MTVDHKEHTVTITSEEMRVWMGALDSINGVLESSIMMPCSAARRIADSYEELILIYNKVLAS